MKKALFPLLFLLSFFLTAQEKKMEREFQLKKEEVPLTIMDLLSTYLKDSKRTNFYREIDGSKKSIEVKLKLKKALFSIEFDDDHRLEDIELIIRAKAVPKATYLQIEQFFQQYERWKIHKIQKQFSSETWEDERIIKNALTRQIGDIIKYEIEVSLQQEGAWQPFEMLFDSLGTLIFKREIDQRSSDFILY